LLSWFHDGMQWFGFDPSAERRQLAASNADKALSLDPNSALAHVAKGINWYHGSRNYEAAIKELEIARGIAPNDATVLFWLGPIYRRQARWDEAVAILERATALDPLNANYLWDYASTLHMMRRYRQATPVYERIANVQPDDPTMPASVAYNRFLDTGDVAPVDKALANIPAGFDPACQVSQFRAGMASLERRYDAAIAAVAACKERFVTSSGGEQVPKEMIAVGAQWLASGRQRAALAPKLRAELERSLAARPDQPNNRLNLAFILATLGERQRALAETERALADMPLKRDALLGAQVLTGASQMHANLGEDARALDELEQALRLPGGPNIQEVKLDPIWDPLRNNPRFQQILAEHSSKT